MWAVTRCFSAVAELLVLSVFVTNNRTYIKLIKHSPSTSIFVLSFGVFCVDFFLFS